MPPLACSIKISSRHSAPLPPPFSPRPGPWGPFAKSNYPKKTKRGWGVPKKKKKIVFFLFLFFFFCSPPPPPCPPLQNPPQLSQRFFFFGFFFLFFDVAVPPPPPPFLCFFLPPILFVVGNLGGGTRPPPPKIPPRTQTEGKGEKPKGKKKRRRWSSLHQQQGIGGCFFLLASCPPSNTSTTHSPPLGAAGTIVGLAKMALLFLSIAFCQKKGWRARRRVTGRRNFFFFQYPSNFPRPKIAFRPSGPTPQLPELTVPPTKQVSCPPAPQPRRSTFVSN